MRITGSMLDATAFSVTGRSHVIVHLRCSGHVGKAYLVEPDFARAEVGPAGLSATRICAV